MKKQLNYIIVTGFVLCFPAMLVSFTGAVVNKAGAPASCSGAPGEITCANAGCHDSFQPNIGFGKRTIQLNNGLGSYVPGQSYTVNITAEDDQVTQFGFQWVALDQAGKNAGTPSLTNTDRTAIVGGSGPLGDRRYVTQTANGSTTVKPGSDSWSFTWQAPATDVGPVTFYVATVAGNDDGMALWDLVYTDSLVLSSPSAIEKIIAPAPFEMKLSRDHASVLLEVQALSAASVTVEIMDLSGKRAWSKAWDLAAGSNTFRITPTLPEGLYLLSLGNRTHRISQRLLIGQ